MGCHTSTTGSRTSRGRKRRDDKASYVTVMQTQTNRERAKRRLMVRVPVRAMKRTIELAGIPLPMIYVIFMLKRVGLRQISKVALIQILWLRR